MLGMKAILLSALFVFTFYLPLAVSAQTEIVPDTVTLLKASVLEVMSSEKVILPGTDTASETQRIRVEILESTDKGSVVEFENDYIQLEEGDVFFLRHIGNELSGTDYYSVADPYRINILVWLLGAFLVLLFAFGGIQGVRGLISLCGSFALIFFILLPGILAGISPVLISIGVSSLIIVVGSYITHGFNKTTTSAVLGMIATILMTGIAAYYAVDLSSLSGFTSEENVYLHFDTRGSIDMTGLLFGAIMIGLLGVLYDIAIGQSVAIDEISRAGSSLTVRELYKRGLRVGREHIGALVNTLAIAYVGVSLPFLLLIYNSPAGFATTINSELFATEIIRILIGSIGLIIAVPITTLIAAYMLAKKEPDS